jgi:hypothetical protein
VPISGTVCGLPPPLSATDTLAVSDPVMVGVNVTVMVQLAPMPRLVPQVVPFRMKLLELGPVIVMLVMDID